MKTVFAFLVAWLFANGPACHAAADAMLAPGPPVLTENTVNQVMSFFEWALDLRFSDNQKREYTAMMAEEWSKPEVRQSTVHLLKNVEKANEATPEKRQSVQPQMQRLLLEGMWAEPENVEARWMLAAYENAHHTTNPQITDSPGSQPLTGRWRATHAAALQYKASSTGALAPTSGSSFFYEFLADGTYRFNGTLQVTTYGCTSSVYQEQTGRYQTANGGLLSLAPARGTVRSQTCGGPLKEKEADLQSRALQFHFESSGGTETLVINNASGNARPDYFRRER